jgi:hypothetical protein
MYHGSVALTAVLLATGVAAANAPPSPGRLIPVEHTVTTDKEYPDYDFYLIDPGNKKVVAVKFGPKNPIELKAKPGESYSYRLAGVPKGEEKNYANEEDFHSTLGKEGGAHQSYARRYFESSVSAALTDKRDRIVREHKVEKIDAKESIIVLTTKDVESKKDAPEDDDAPGVSAYAPRDGTLVAGVAASLAVMLGGLWLAGRVRARR